MLDTFSLVITLNRRIDLEAVRLIRQTESGQKVGDSGDVKINVRPLIFW